MEPLIWFQVQLVRALTETELKRKTRDPTYVASKEHTGIPLVKESRGLTGTDSQHCFCTHQISTNILKLRCSL